MSIGKPEGSPQVLPVLYDILFVHMPSDVWTKCSVPPHRSRCSGALSLTQQATGDSLLWKTTIVCPEGC